MCTIQVIFTSLDHNVLNPMISQEELNFFKFTNSLEISDKYLLKLFTNKLSVAE